MMMPSNRKETLQVEFKIDDKQILKEDKWLRSRLGGEEKILFRSKLSKHNNKGVVQQRVLLITTEFIYNLAYEDFFVKLFSMMDSSTAIKRKIPIELISAFTVSCFPSSNEFVIHIEKQHDYRYSAEERTREAALTAICLAFRLKTGRKLPFHFKEESDLGRYQTHEKDVKKNISKRPIDAAIHLSDQDLAFGLEFFAKSRKEITKNYIASRNSITTLVQNNKTIVKVKSNPDNYSLELNSNKSKSTGIPDSPTNSQGDGSYNDCDVNNNSICTTHKWVSDEIKLNS